MVRCPVSLAGPIHERMYWRAALCVCVMYWRPRAASIHGPEPRLYPSSTLQGLFCLMVCGLRSLCQGLWSMVCSLRCTVCVPWYGPWSMFHGMVCGLWSMFRGLWSMAYGVLPMVYGLRRETPPALKRLGKGTTSGNSAGALALMAPWHSCSGLTLGSQARALGVTAPWRSWIALALMALRLSLDLSRGQPREQARPQRGTESSESPDGAKSRVVIRVARAHM